MKTYGVVTVIWLLKLYNTDVPPWVPIRIWYLVAAVNPVTVTDPDKADRLVLLVK